MPFEITTEDDFIRLVCWMTTGEVSHKNGKTLFSAAGLAGEDRWTISMDSAGVHFTTNKSNFSTIVTEEFPYEAKQVDVVDALCMILSWENIPFEIDCRQYYPFDPYFFEIVAVNTIEADALARVRSRLVSKGAMKRI